MPIDTLEVRTLAKKDPSIRAITDMVAFKIWQSPDDKGPEANFVKAHAAVVDYIIQNFKDIEEFKTRFSQVSGDTRGLQETAEAIYRDCFQRKYLTFEIVRDTIRRGEDIALKTITDMIAYKVYQSPENQGPEINLITAETFVAHYVSENFVSLDGFHSRLEELGSGVSALRQFADTVYRYYCDQRPA